MGREMRRWGVERAVVGEHEQQEWVWRLRGVGSSSPSRCCHSYPDPGRNPTDMDSVLLANKRNAFESNLSVRCSLRAFSQMLRNDQTVQMGRNWIDGGGKDDE